MPVILPLRFPLRFRHLIIMIRTEDEMGREVGESQSLPCVSEDEIEKSVPRAGLADGAAQARERCAHFFFLTACFIRIAAAAAIHRRYRV
eukprot:COSAG01_NODE_7080_length_3362_cov_2.022372_3_plen_90_part_00